jgi:hypothetical protein
MLQDATHVTVRVVDGAHGLLDRGERMLREIDDLEGVAHLEQLLDGVDHVVDALRVVVIDLGAAFRRAEELSRKHASKALARSLDVLHVAALIEIGCETLVSGDDRQITLAKAEGLRALDIRAGV